MFGFMMMKPLISLVNRITFLIKKLMIDLQQIIILQERQCTAESVLCSSIHPNGALI